jgi:hypothetical protein
MMSFSWSFWTTSMPEMTWANTVKSFSMAA